MSRKDWMTGYSKKTVTDYVNHAGFSSKTKYLVWGSKYAQHVYLFKGYKGHWKLIEGGKNKTPGWSNLAASGKVALATRNGNYTIFGKQKKADRAKYDYYYLSKLHSTVRLHTTLMKNGKGPMSGKYYNKVLGNPMSHGCFRMRPAAAKYIYTKFPRGTKAIIY